MGIEMMASGYQHLLTQDLSFGVDRWLPSDGDSEVVHRLADELLAEFSSCSPSSPTACDARRGVRTRSPPESTVAASGKSGSGWSRTSIGRWRRIRGAHWCSTNARSFRRPCRLRNRSRWLLRSATK